MPFLLQIHDLKHVHRPGDHPTADLARRRRWGRVARAATLVVTGYEHVRRDIVRHLGVPEARTAVLSPACPIVPSRPAEVDSSGEPSVSVPDEFVLMPAQLWPHKNHQRVIEAVADLRRTKGLAVPVVCTGQTGGECHEHARRLAAQATRLGVADLIRFVGFVDPPTLNTLYARARMVLVATLYDPGSFPVMEALALGKPLAASRVTSIPQTVGDAALLFDPESPTELAAAIERLWTDDELCRRLARRGPRRVERRRWDEVGRDWLRLCERAAERATPQMAMT